ncbi:MAG: hypothetical protein IBJ13_14605 [Sphingopyxis sp.]|nr:hypothetical protein [Sphingopyxis sp.]
MESFRVATALVGALGVLAANAQAQEAPAATETAAAVEAAPAAAPAAPAVAVAAIAPTLMLPSYSEIILTPDVEASSKQLREGDTVLMHSLFDVMHNGVVVIPKGTPAKGTVTWRTGKGAFGKSAKMEITFNDLTMPNGQKVALAGKHRQEGAGNTGAAVGAVVAVGVFGAFVTGKSAIIPVGQHLTARTADSLAYVIPAGAKIVPTAELAAPAAAAAPVAAAPVAEAAAEPAAAPAEEPVAATTPTEG